jgi:2-dehydropantoate 2-reductase
MTYPKVAVVGAGAVGCYFGGMLARAGVPVTLIARPRHVEAIERDGLFIDGVSVQERIKVGVSTEMSAARGADVILFSVKTVDTESAAKSLVLHLRNNALVLSLQNGVDNVERIHDAVGLEAIPTVVYVAAAMVAPGHVKHSGAGNLIVGGAHRRAELDSVAVVFEKSGVPCRISDRIDAELWTKFIMNLAYNAISALTQKKYGVMVADPHIRGIMTRATKEAVAVARVMGVDLDEPEVIEKVIKLADVMSGATSSTAQDVARGNRTEIESLNGYLVRRGVELGVDVPVNQTLSALVRLLESREDDSSSP